MSTKPWVPRTLAICACLLLAAGLAHVGMRKLLWETWSGEKDIVLANGSPLHVRESGSKRRFFGHPHIISFGGGDPTHHIEFSFADRTYEWSGPFTPVVLQFEQECPVLIVFDRETDLDWTFRYFRHSGQSWAELSLTEFPPHLALQNLWLRHDDGMRDGVPIDAYVVVKERDPHSIDFRDSLTAIIWHCISTGQQYWQAPHLVDSEFLELYMRLHSIPRPAS